ncbi:MAG: Hpt domain-containing protein [Pseudomonadota bacterium]
MTDNSHVPPFDTGPLSWVMGEIRDALERSRGALLEASGRSADAQATSLQHAKAHLHQAHGALQMVDVEGVGLMTAAAEQVLERCKEGQLPCTAETAQVVANAYQAVTEYLEELLAGAPPQAARLFPYYRALQELLGAQRIHPADLFFADLSAPAGLPPGSGGTPDYAACRARFEKSLLPFLKNADATSAQGMQEAIATVADAQQDAAPRRFWLAMQCFAELVASAQLASNLNVKQLFGMINLEMRRLAQGQATLPEPMLRDALFFVAAAAKPSPAAQQLRSAYRLDGVVAPDYDQRRYGRIDAAALTAAREALAQAKATWGRLASEIDATLESQFEQALATLHDASTRLGVPALAQLMAELARVAKDSVASGRNDQFSLEMATAMLFIEHGLDQVRQLPENFDAHAEVIGARLLALAAGETPPDAPQWQGDLSRKIEQGQTVAVLAAEMKSGLRNVEKILDDYYADASRRDTLAQIDPVMHQLQGALAILDQDHAMRAALHVKDAVHTLATSVGEPQHEAESLQNIAQNIGALGFFIDMLGQNFDAAKERFEFDAAGRMFQAVPFGKGAAAAPPAEVQEAPAPAPLPVAPAPVHQGEEEVEAELLEIFISEAQEVLAFVAATLPRAHAEPGNQETLTMLRRSFHTLKGSGRMVGLNLFADGAAAVEKVMNAWLAEGWSASVDLLELLDHAATFMGGWVEQLATTGHSERNSDALVAAAARVQDGEAFSVDAAPALAEVIDMPLPYDDAEPEEIEALPLADNVIEFPTIAQPVPAPLVDDNTKRIGALEIPLPLFNIYLAETDEIMRVLTQDFGEWRHEPARAVTPAALKAAHTLAGTSATVGFKALREIAYALEMALKMLAPPAPQLNDGQRDLLDTTLDTARTMLLKFAQGELGEARPELVAQLQALREVLATQEAASAYASVEPDLATRLDELFKATLEVLVDNPPEILAAQAPLAPTPAHLVDEMDQLFDSAFDAPELTQAAAPPLDLVAEPEPVAAPEPVPEPEPEPLPEPELIAALEAVPEPVAMAATAPEMVAIATIFTDDLDPDLLPVFLEEATDLLPEIGNGLRAWQHNPADAAPAQKLLRILHTVKGSARMAGAMRLGQHTHELETQIENMVHAGTTTSAAFDELMANYDHALLLFEQLQAPAPAAAPAPSNEPTPIARAVDEGHAVQSRAPLVRVRADILDRLVNQAGEVSITRSKLENQVSAVKSSLLEFADNLARLRRQLREVEMQAESQIASRMSISSEREFDPLEFDRFTRLQELTRMMAESVDDVGSFHESLTRTVDGASDDLAVQSRLTRDLQRDLMRVRMVPFASLSERLFRVARQTAKEIDKRVNLDIRGGSVEIDRSVLEQMAAPFEHLLRNAIVHGIEARERRLAAGKMETGELLVQVSQQGNEVVIQFSDDGAGLDLERIRAKARQNGLTAEGVEVSDLEAADLIFEPGFSTADALTELAGRGVGMDVVRSEAQALGGRVAIVSEAGKGARFTIHLPLTLAVTQVVLTTSGGKTYALPSILVEQVLQVKEAAVLEAHGSGKLDYQGQALPLHYLPALLGDAQARPLPQRSCPVLILRNGADRIALHVDDILGNREVVIKNIGPQLSRMIGIAGATVLGSGDIVLILNPVALSHHLDHHPELRRHFTGTVASAQEMRSSDFVIMVVDDSLTVRKVTQRLLEREGYQVLLAKDGVDALEQLQESRPDLMLVDIEMPRMDGFDLTRNLRGNDLTRDIPIIMITSRTADKHRNYAMDLGVNAYFGKPFQEAVLLAAIAGLLHREAVA